MPIVMKHLRSLLLAALFASLCTGCFLIPGEEEEDDVCANVYSRYVRDASRQDCAAARLGEWIEGSGCYCHGLNVE